MQREQLLTESQVFEQKFFPGTESADHPAEKMPERHDHGENLIRIVRIELFAKSFILWVYDVLARHRPVNLQEPEAKRLRSLGVFQPYGSDFSRDRAQGRSAQRLYIC